MAQFRVLGVNDDQDVCGWCGKTNLKRVVWLVALDPDGNPAAEPEAVGRCCAARALRVTTARVQALAEQADTARQAAEAARVYLVGAERSVRDWVVEAVGQNGGSVTRLCFANGHKPAVERWAEARFPNRLLEVRLVRGGAGLVNGERVQA